jgi:hypothetical protein
MKIGIVGLPKTGKTSLFNLLTGSAVPTSTFGGPRGELHVGMARVLDPRVDRLGGVFAPRRTTYATFEVVDLAGITRGERQGLEAAEFRNADALLHVVRAFPEPAGADVNVARDVADLEAELILADLDVVERRLGRLAASLKKRPTEAERREEEVLRRLKTLLEGETPLREVPLEGPEAKLVRGFTFLSQKPILHCVNLDEKDLARGAALAESFGLVALLARPHTRVGWVSAVIEAEVAQLAGEEQAAFLSDLGLAEPAITRVLRDCYELLGLISFFTVGEDEVRAWSVPRGTRAQDAAGAVHSDIARGFIRAEVVTYEALMAAGGSMAQARERGQLGLEGKDYVVQDGDICHFRFNVTR